jgi:hypothetical protein
VKDPFALDEAVAALRRFGLVKATEDALLMHRLLQQVIRDRLDLARTTSRVGSAARLVGGLFPQEGSATQGPGSSVHACSAKCTTSSATTTRPRQHLQRALAISKASLGTEHLSVAMTLFRLSQVHNQSGDPHAAREHLQRALAIRQTVVGPDDPRTARVHAQLAALQASSPDTTARYDPPQSWSQSPGCSGLDVAQGRPTGCRVEAVQRRRCNRTERS